MPYSEKVRACICFPNLDLQGEVRRINPACESCREDIQILGNLAVAAATSPNLPKKLSGRTWWGPFFKMTARIAEQFANCPISFVYHRGSRAGAPRWCVIKCMKQRNVDTLDYRFAQPHRLYTPSKMTEIYVSLPENGLPLDVWKGNSGVIEAEVAARVLAGHRSDSVCRGVVPTVVYAGTPTTGTERRSVASPGRPRGDSVRMSAVPGSSSAGSPTRVQKPILVDASVQTVATVSYTHLRAHET